MATVAEQDKVESKSGGSRGMGKYRLFARLGTGGMADVYLSVAQGAMNVNRLVVVKRLRDEHAADPSSREMFLNEARIAARLSHPNVIQTFEAGNEGGSYILTMEYVDGQPLSRVLSKLKREGKQLDPRMAARIIADALNGLHYAHELNDFDGTPLELVHRDVSPHNIMLTYEGMVKLVDFGIAKAAGTAQTAHGVFKGKVSFMAPEQVVGEGVDRRADIFAAGIVLWEAVTQKPLMADESPAKTLYNLMHKEIPRASTITPIPEALDDIIAKSLERDLAVRYQTAKQMRDALEAFLAKEGPVSHEEVGELTKGLFDDTRKKVQAQIKAQLATLSLTRTSEPALDEGNTDVNNSAIRSTGGLLDLSDLASGGDTSGSGAAFRVASGTTAAPVEPPSALRKYGMFLWGGLTLVTLAASAVALMRTQSQPPPPAPPAPAAVRPDPTETATAPATATATNPATAVDATTPATAAASAADAAPTTKHTAVRPVWTPPKTAAPAAAPAPAPEPAKSSAPPAKTQEPASGRTFRRDL